MIGKPGYVLHIKPINQFNREQAEALTLLPAQEGYIESVSECLAEADEFKAWRPVGICAGGILVGFAMYGMFPETSGLGRVWLDRLLIDCRYQGRGYGKSAVAALLERIREEYHVSHTYLSVYDDNEPAIRLYKQIGFRFNGELDTKGERVMVFEFAERP